MSDQYLGEIRIVGFNFAPYGWAQCMGQVMSISQNNALFALFGTTYGGNGQSTFSLPDLQGRVPVGYGGASTNGAPAYVQGQVGGVASVTQLISNMPVHNHAIVSNLSAQVSTTVLGVEANLAEPVAGSVLALPVDSNGNAISLFHAPDATKPQIPLGPNNAVVNGTITAATSGQSVPISVINPYLAVNYIVALQGVFPTRG